MQKLLYQGPVVAHFGLGVAGEKTSVGVACQLVSVVQKVYIRATPMAVAVFRRREAIFRARLAS